MTEEEKIRLREYRKIAKRCKEMLPNEGCTTFHCGIKFRPDKRCKHSATVSFISAKCCTKECPKINKEESL